MAKPGGGELERYLGEDIHHRGIAAWIARLRVPLGFLMAVLIVWFAAPTRTSLTIGAAVAVLGEALRLWAAGHLNKSREVTMSGPYRWTAHPLYAGTALIGAGVAIVCKSLAVAAVIALYLGATLLVAITREEAFLRAKFGAAYATYRDGAMRHGGVPTSRFSLARARANREHRAAAGLLVAMGILAWLVWTR